MPIETRGWSVVVPLLAVEEGRSDLSLTATVHDAPVRVVGVDVHVLQQGLQSMCGSLTATRDPDMTRIVVELSSSAVLRSMASAGTARSRPR